MSSHCAQGQWTRAPGGLFLKKWCDQCARLVGRSPGRDCSSLITKLHSGLLASMLHNASSKIEEKIGANFLWLSTSAALE